MGPQAPMLTRTHISPVALSEKGQLRRLIGRVGPKYASND